MSVTHQINVCRNYKNLVRNQKHLESTSNVVQEAEKYLTRVK